MADDPQNRAIRDADYSEHYANNVQFEPSVFDIKAIFGTIDQFAIPPTIRQHTGMTLSWPQAKLLLYFLYANVLLQENAYGKIAIPHGAKPQPFESILHEAVKDLPSTRAMVDRITRLATDLFDSEAPPASARDELKQPSGL